MTMALAELDRMAVQQVVAQPTTVENTLTRVEGSHAAGDTNVTITLLTIGSEPGKRVWRRASDAARTSAGHAISSAEGKISSAEVASRAAEGGPRRSVEGVAPPHPPSSEAAR